LTSLKLNQAQSLARSYEIQTFNSPGPSAAAVSAVNEVLHAPAEKAKGKRGRKPKSAQTEAPIETQQEPSEVTPYAKRLRSRKNAKQNE
jgi:hypothetical protein